MSNSDSNGASAGPPLATRVFTRQDQEWFAGCSGDFNPIHLDPVAARRELPGAPVVHGMHLLLWALEVFASVRPPENVRIVRLKCSFSNPVYLDVPVEVQVVSVGETSVKMAMVQNGLKTAKCAVELDRFSDEPPLQAPAAARRWSCQPADEPFSALSGKRGATPLQAGTGDLPAHFGHAAGLLGWTGILDLLAITRMVGMECPGWHSMLSSVALSFLRDVPRDNLQYVVKETDPRIGLVTMDVSGGWFHGEVCAFYRPGRVPQIRFEDARRMVNIGEFNKQRALIIGGSRGIGETTAKLIAAGGGSVCITYHVGAADAQSVCRDIARSGGGCHCAGYCVADPERGLDGIAGLGFVPTHIYYYATRPLVRTRRAAFNGKLFSDYAEFYVAGFAELYLNSLRRWRNRISFFYPSSVAVEEHQSDLVEYGCAKAAGEALCASLKAQNPHHQIHVVRLPLIATELSRGLIETEAANAADVMLPILRSMPRETDSTEEHQP